MHGEYTEHGVLTDLVSEYQQLVYATCLRVLRNAADAEDATQETFLKIFKNHSAVRKNISAWVYQCAKNTALNMRRSLNSRVKREELVGRERIPSASSEHAELIDLLDTALEEMPEQSRLIIVEYYLLERSQRELAEMLQISQPAVKKRVDKSMAQLSVIIKRLGTPCALLLLVSSLKIAADEAVPATVHMQLKKLTLAQSQLYAAGTGLVGTTWSAVIIGGSVLMTACVVTWIAFFHIEPSVWSGTGSAELSSVEASRPVIAPVASGPVEELALDFRIAGNGMYHIDKEVLNVRFSAGQNLPKLLYKKSRRFDDMGYDFVDVKPVNIGVVNYQKDGLPVPIEKDVYVVLPNFLTADAYRIDIDMTLDGILDQQRFVIAGKHFTILEYDEEIARKKHTGRKKITVCLVWTDVDGDPVWDVSYAIDGRPYIRFTTQLRHMHDLVLWGNPGAIIHQLHVQTMIM